MKTDDIITIVFIILFVVLPLLKKGWDAFAGNEEKKETLKEVESYLNEIRSSAPQKQQTYEQPKRYEQKSYKKPVKKEATKPIVEVKQEEEKKPLQTSQPAVVEKLAEKVSVIHNIMIDQKFSEVQKAIIFSELFKKPKSLS